MARKFKIVTVYGPPVSGPCCSGSHGKAITIVLGFTWLLSVFNCGCSPRPPASVSHSTFERIRSGSGMRLADVEAILGPSEQADFVGLHHADIVEIKMWQAPDGNE